MQLLVLHHHVPYFDFSYKNDIWAFLLIMVQNTINGTFYDDAIIGVASV